MPKQRRADKEKEPKDQLSNVDKTFFELTITDLNNKLSHLRTHTVKLEERNEELETQITQLTEDRADVTAYLDRSLRIKISNIRDLEEKLSELAKVRADETKNFQKQIHDLELKFKTMQEELTSEIKLLNGKLNSLEEFRIQKDELMAKFDQQDMDLKEQTKRHQTVLYDMERKQVVDKDRLKRDVENKLLQLSNEFAKANEIRIAAHVQRLVRENIALNNELDRMMFSQRRLQTENKAIKCKGTDDIALANTVHTENKILIRTCDAQLEIIKKLTDECEGLKQKAQHQYETEHLLKHSTQRETNARDELDGNQHKIKQLEQHVHWMKTECDANVLIAKQYAAEVMRLLGILHKLKLTIKSAIRGQKQDDDDVDNNDLLEYRHMQRNTLLSELMKVVMETGDGPAIVSSSETISSVGNVYAKGDAGITPRDSAKSSSRSLLLDIKKPDSRYELSIQMSGVDTKKIDDDLQSSTSNLDDNQLSSKITEPKYKSFPIIDLESGTVIAYSDSSKGGDAQPVDDALEDEADIGVSSSDEDEQGAAAAAAKETSSTAPTS